jgi:hypothetical protein
MSPEMENHRFAHCEVKPVGPIAKQQVHEQIAKEQLQKTAEESGALATKQAFAEAA